MKRLQRAITVIGLFIAIPALAKKPEWVALIDGSSISYDKNSRLMPNTMELNNGTVLSAEDWNGFLKDYIESFPPNKREVILQGLTRFVVKYDRVDKIIRFSPQFTRYVFDGPPKPNVPPNWSFISLTGTLGQKNASAFVQVQYSGDDWIFADSIKIVADDYTWESPKIDFKRDNSKMVWEYALLNYSDPEIAKLVDKIISSKEAIVRFKGKYYYDLTVTRQMRDDMRYMLAAIKAINEPVPPAPAPIQQKNENQSK